MSRISTETADCVLVSILWPKYSLDAERLNLTDFHTTKVRAGNNVHGGSITSDGEVEDDDDPPVFDEGWNSIDQTPEKRQKSEFNSHHCHPSEYKACCDQLTKLENRI